MSVPPRTTGLAVQGILQDDYNKARSPSLTGYIQTASSVVDKVVAIAPHRGFPINAVDAELIERWLAAGYYTVMDQTYQSRTTEGASGQFRGQTEQGVLNYYFQTAVNLDPSGVLHAILTRKFASASHMGCTRGGAGAETFFPPGCS